MQRPPGLKVILLVMAVVVVFVGFYKPSGYSSQLQPYQAQQAGSAAPVKRVYPYKYVLIDVAAFPACPGGYAEFVNEGDNLDALVPANTLVLGSGSRNVKQYRLCVKKGEKGPGLLPPVTRDNK